MGGKVSPVSVFEFKALLRQILDRGEDENKANYLVTCVA